MIRKQINVISDTIALMFSSGLKAVAGATTVDTGVGGNLDVSEYPKVSESVSDGPEPVAETVVIVNAAEAGTASKDAKTGASRFDLSSFLKSLLGL